MKKQSIYPNIREGYGAFSIYAALQNPIRRPVPTNTCFCMEAEPEYPHKLPKEGKCIETAYCKYCDINEQEKCPF